MRRSLVFRRHHPVLHQLSTAERLVSCVFQPQFTSRSGRQASCRCGGRLYNNNNSIAAPKRHHNSRTYVPTMKRKPQHLEDQTRAKRSRPVVPEYHLTPSFRNDDGEIVWPAPDSQIRRAREIISECAKAQQQTLIVPDKDADGLSSGVILRKTLELLGLAPECISIHLLQKGTNVHSEVERDKMQAIRPAYIFVLDQGSRKSSSLVDGPHTALVIDHHYATADDFPLNSDHVTACNSPPVATTSLLTYHICEPLHTEVATQCAWLCVVGTHGDLGNTIKWESPFPDMKATFKQYTKKSINDAVSYVNAPRRTATYDVSSAWDALVSAEHPADVSKHPRLLAARQEVNAEVERCTHTAPKFSQDGKVAVFRISSQAQVHPVIATRWAGHLQSKALEIIMVANEGYLDGKVNFSCRIPRCARGREVPVDIIQSLKDYASLTHNNDEDDTNGETTDVVPPLLERLGDNFARGHVQASGGIVDVPQFEELMRLMRVGEKAEKKDGEGGPSPKKSSSSGKKTTLLESNQKNTLMNYFGKK